MPGTQGIYPPYPMPRDLREQKVMQSREALYGRTTYFAGPVPSYVQLYPGSGITPAQIQNYQNEVLVAGWMANWACLTEQVMLRDAHLASVDRSRRAAVAGKPFFVRPVNNTPLAAGVAEYVTAVVDQIDGFSASQYELLAANGDGWKCQEIVWRKPKPIRFGGKAVTAEVPEQLDTVHNKHFRFDVGNGRILLDNGHGTYNALPAHKFLYHVAVGDGPSRRRGYHYQAIWLHMIKHNAIARWAVVLEIWGIPVPHGKADSALWQDPVRKAEMQAIVRDAGLGKPFVTTDDFVIDKAFDISTGDARGMHAALIGWVETEQSKLVQLQTLTTELGGVGSYKASETHENTKETGERMDARQLEDTDRDQLFRSIVERAVWQYADDGAILGALPGGLCDALGASPDDILRHIPRAFYRIDREMTSQARSQIYKDAVEMGLDVSANQYLDEFGLDKAHSKETRIPGKATTIADGAQSIGEVEAAQGIDNPKDPTTAKPAPVQKPPTPAPRAEEQR